MSNVIECFQQPLVLHCLLPWLHVSQTLQQMLTALAVQRKDACMRNLTALQ